MFEEVDELGDAVKIVNNSDSDHALYLNSEWKTAVVVIFSPPFSRD
jgi:hypothetical protein